MTKQCPNCGTEIDIKEEICPNCGFAFKDEKNDTVSSKANDKDEQTEENTSSFLNKDQNENIEWSELKDMSIGHVMTMFNEQPSEDSETHTSEETLDSNTSIDENPNASEHAEIVVPEETKPPEEAELTKEPVTLNQYINDHKNEKQESKQTETPEETSNMKEQDEAETDEETVHPAIKSEESSKTRDKGQEEMKEKEEKAVKTKESTESSEKLNEESGKNAIDKFTPPVDHSQEGKTFGPKALPAKSSDIPSKSKKPEEIEMDAAPIFFKDGEDPKGAKKANQFKKPVLKNKADTSKSAESTKQLTNKNYKKMSIVLAAVVVLAGGAWFAYSQTQNPTTGTQVAKNQDELAEQTEKELNSYFTDDKQLFIKPEMVSLSPNSLKENLDSLKDSSNYNDLEALYKKVTEKQAAITNVNELFTEPVIDGSNLKEGLLKADKQIDVARREENDDFVKLLNQGLDQAIEQYDQLQHAKAAVDVFYQNSEITSALTRETYTAAKAEVDKVKNEALRNPLNETLVKAESVLVSAETAAAQQQQAAINQAASQANTAAADAVVPENNNQTAAATGQQPDSSTFSAPNADGVYTDPVYSVNPNDVADMSNPAWAWAPGVQEKVIATSIERGYIVAGGYSLQPARIINGEGYYNMYNSEGQYLVTINAKTGWFKGNASRNAGR